MSTIITNAVSFDAEQYIGNGAPLALSQAWIEGGNGEVEFDLVCGAGLGGAFIRLTVKVGDERVTEYVDIRKGLTEWVSRIADEIKARQAVTP